MAVDSNRKEEFLVLDGGVATELTRAGFNLDVSQKSARVSLAFVPKANCDQLFRIDYFIQSHSI